MKKRTGQESPEELVQELRALLAEAESMVSASPGATAAAEGMNGDEGTAAGDPFAGLFARLREKAADTAERADDAIRAHPYESMAIALGVGLLLGALLRSGRD